LAEWPLKELPDEVLIDLNFLIRDKKTTKMTNVFQACGVIKTAYPACGSKQFSLMLNVVPEYNENKRALFYVRKVPLLTGVEV
jgi:hypothetical protein